MKKDVLKRGLIRVFKMEENATNIYLDRISSILTIFSHNKKALKEIQQIQQMSVRSTQHHRDTCQNILSHLDLDDKNDY